MAALHRAEWMAIGVCPELCLSTACGHGIYVYKGVEFNSDSRPCNAHQSPERQYISFCSKWDFYVQAGEAKGGKKECAITSAPCWVHLMPRYDSITSPAPTNQFHYSWEEQGLGLVMIWSSLFLSFNQITVLWGVFFSSPWVACLKRIWMAARFRSPERWPHRSGAPALRQTRDGAEWQPTNTHTLMDTHLLFLGQF